MEWLKLSENLRKRIISAGALAPIVLTIVYMGGAWFSAMVVFATVIMSCEWQSIIHTKQEPELTSEQTKKWEMAGVFYVGIFATSLLYLRALDQGFGLVLLVLMMVWATDIAAYFSGRIIGGPKIYPPISPNKTWAGLIGGMVAAGCVGGFASIFMEGTGSISMVLLGATLAVVAQSGDFLESWVKRRFGVKDSGTLIPGHGGLMDRLDGFVTTVPVFSLITLFNGGNFFQ